MSIETAEQEKEQAQVASDSTEVAERKPGILSAARTDFDKAQIQAIKASVAKDCSDAELVMFLEVCARYQLDPFTKQVFAAKMNGDRGPVSIIVSRDGLLAHAHRQSDFVKMDGDVVHANDGFESSMINGERTIVHTVKAPADRGAIVGAWAMVERKDHGQTYFFAPLSEYKRNSPIWGKHPSAMILKVAESYALRKAYSISGVVGEAEVEASNPASNITSIPGTARDLHPDWGDDPVLAQDLKAAVETIRAIEPENWMPPKINAMLSGATDDQRRQLLAEIDAKLPKSTGGVVSDEAAPSEPEVVDAEVVTEEAADSPSEPVSDQSYGRESEGRLRDDGAVVDPQD